MKDREYFLQLISDSLDRELTPAEIGFLAAAQEQDAHLVEYEQLLRQQRTALRNLPVLTADESARYLTKPAHRSGPWRRVWRIQLRIPLPVAAGLALCLVGWAWLAGGAGRQPVEPSTSAPAKYVQVERLEPAIAVPAAYTIDSVTTTIQEGEI